MRRPRAAVVTVAGLLGLTASLAAQDPWSRVPAFPTSCYDTGNPGFLEMLSSFRHEVVAAADRQTAINSALRQKLIDMDPSEKQSKMMAFMMKNPTEAGQMMQDIAAAGQQSNQFMEQFLQKKAALDEQLNSAESLYLKAKAPLDAVLQQWNAAQPDHGKPRNPVLSRQLAARYDAEYEHLCAKWLRADSSPLLKYLSDLKAFQISEQIPGELERERHLKREFDLYGVAHGTLKSTAAQQAVLDYVTAMTTVFRRRDTQTLTARSK